MLSQPVSVTQHVPVSLKAVASTTAVVYQLSMVEMITSIQTVFLLLDKEIRHLTTRPTIGNVYRRILDV